ncbi:13075_t:CDS:2 [Entrophospora sp. SA101]|nr:13075_t:CDS:2 [Entrophospora sp. SA101]
MSAAIDYNKVIFGKEVKKIKIEDKRYLILQHHEEVKSISATTSPSTETWQSPKLNHCTGCSLDENHIVNMYHNQRKQCHIMVHDDKTIKVPYMRQNNYITKVHIQSTKNEIENQIKEKYRRSINTSEHNQSMIVETQLPKGINYIRNLFNSNEITEVLINTYEKNVNETSEEYSFYTDGSVKQIGTLNTCSGIAWLQTTGAAKEGNLDINFIKVKAHKQEHHNNVVDKLAKEGTTSTNLEYKVDRKYNLTYNAFWKNNLIQKPLRGFIKKLGQVEQFATWVLINRNLNLWAEIEFHEIDWESTWFNIFGAEKATKADLHYKSLFLRIYKVKLLHNELPTLTNLKIRQPKGLVPRSLSKAIAATSN